MNTLTSDTEIGIIVDAGPALGYGHVVRCVRLARALQTQNSIVFYPLSNPCKEFVESAGYETAALPKFTVTHGPLRGRGRVVAFPPLVITDLREAHGITAEIHRYGSRHLSIHDLGLAQCHSDAAIDGSISRLFPYQTQKDRDLFLGPHYMITRGVVPRKNPGNKVLVTFGGGSTARFAENVSEQLSRLGLCAVTTHGFAGAGPLSDPDFAEAISSCKFAISGCGVTLYDLLASGVPTLAVAFDRIQLRTGDAFHELGAVLSMGLLARLPPAALVRHCREMLENKHLAQRIGEAGRTLVDGKGLSRVIEIVRRQLWLTNEVKTFTAC